MAKNEKFSIQKLENGVFMIKKGTSAAIEIDLRKMAQNEKFELLKWEILNMGVFFSPKIEKLVRKML